MAAAAARGLKGVSCFSGTAQDGPAEFRGFVTIHAEAEDGDVLVGQLSPAEVRTLALQYLSVAEAAEQDAIVFTVLVRDVGVLPETVAGIVRSMRDERCPPIVTCQAEIGLYLDGAVGPTESFAAATGCTEPATVTLESRCARGHFRRKRLCAEHGQLSPPDGKWFCGPCAELGHDCPVTPQLVTDPETEAP